LFIETLISKGTGKLTLTGNLGDVMKESAVIALEYLKAHAEQFLGLDPAVSVIVAALAGPAARALDASDPVYGIGANEA
jgi:hypothetical protein